MQLLLDNNVCMVGSHLPTLRYTLGGRHASAEVLKKIEEEKSKQTVGHKKQVGEGGECSGGADSVANIADIEDLVKM